MTAATDPHDAHSAHRRRVVVCAVGGRRGDGELPESRIDDERGTISGGERILYEVAVAAALLGHEVELRGHLNARILAMIAEAGGATPAVDLAPRRPERGDIVVLPEAAEPDLVLDVHLSAARGVIFVLAPPGLFGWSFLDGWSRPDPLTVTPHAVGLPESYRAIAGLGFEVWAHSHGDHMAAAAAGVDASYIGQGFPLRRPGPVEKRIDVAIIEDNRWYPLARQVADLLPGDAVTVISTQTSVYGLQEALAPARILAFPTRVEGASRICKEARLVGTVPVVLDSNPFASTEDWGEGVVFAHDLAGIAAEVRRLLADPPRLEELSRMAVQDAERQVDWQAFVERLRAVLAAVAPAAPDSAARAELGRLVTDRWRRHGDALTEAQTAAHRARTELAEALAERDRTAAQLLDLRAALADAASARTLGDRALDEARRELARQRQEAHDAYDQLAAARRELAARQGELEAFRRRRSVRVADHWAIGALVRVVGHSRRHHSGGSTAPG